MSVLSQWACGEKNRNSKWLQSNFVLTQHNIAFQQREMHRCFPTYENQSPLQLDKLNNSNTTELPRAPKGSEFLTSSLASSHSKTETLPQQSITKSLTTSKAQPITLTQRHHITSKTQPITCQPGVQLNGVSSLQRQKDDRRKQASSKSANHL